MGAKPALYRPVSFSLLSYVGVVPQGACVVRGFGHTVPVRRPKPAGAVELMALQAVVARACPNSCALPGDCVRMHLSASVRRARL